VKLLYFGILYRFIAGKNILSKNLCRFYQRNSQLGADFVASSVQKLFFSFKKNFGQQNYIALFNFFAQKLCIGIALIDTFLSIAAYL
jgi:hypothetical protein